MLHEKVLGSFIVINITAGRVTSKPKIPRRNSLTKDRFNVSSLSGVGSCSSGDQPPVGPTVPAPELAKNPALEQTERNCARLPTQAMVGKARTGIYQPLLVRGQSRAERCSSDLVSAVFKVSQPDAPRAHAGDLKAPVALILTPIALPSGLRGGLAEMARLPHPGRHGRVARRWCLA